VKRFAIAPAAGKDAAVAAAARSFMAQAPSARVVAVHVVWADWKQYNHDDGLPWFRLKMAQALVQMKGESFCRLYPIEARQEYGGGGRWNPGVTAAAVGRVQVARCK